MTTPSGQISLNDVNVELGLSGTTTISMNQTNVRTLAGVPSGAISMQNLQNKSNRVSISYTFSSNTANASLNLSAIGGYSAGKSDITVTINGGVYLYSTSTGGYGLNLSGGTTGDTLTIVNNGYIMGQGGQGGDNVNGFAGGSAINLGFGMASCTINNTNASAYIGGGGGGGGSGANYNGVYGRGGGGAGGGYGASYYGGYGIGGSIGGSGTNGYGNSSSQGECTYYFGTGGGGGRIFAGTGGAGGTSGGNTGANFGYGGGSGGGGGAQFGIGTSNGGAGGSANASGTNGGTYFAAGGGGGWGASGGSGLNTYGATGGVGGSGGKAVNLNGKSVTWTSGNTTRVYGAVS